MNHSEAVEQMTSERYLLNELTPDARDAFEEHVFDCPECALDLRAGTLFVREAKDQLPDLAASHSQIRDGRSPARKRSFSWFSLWRPAFAVPAFAALLIVVGYQNFVTFPALRQSANEPRLAPLAPLHSATRGATLPTFTADRTHGVALPVDLVDRPGWHASSLLFLRASATRKVNSSGPVVCRLRHRGRTATSRFPSPFRAACSAERSLLTDGYQRYAQGGRTPFEQYNFDIVMTN